MLTSYALHYSCSVTTSLFINVGGGKRKIVLNI